jgi:inhibitor of KinA
VTAEIGPCGDSALLIVLGDRIDRALNERVHGLAGRITTARAEVPGLGAPVAAYASVLVPFDPLALSAEAAEAVLRDLASRAGTLSPERSTASPIEIPVRYGGVDGPDLAHVASTSGLSEAAVAELHASVTYDVYFLGFAPGFAYLGTVPPAIATPRRDTPRSRVPAGSVGIAGEQTGVYPAAMPGGWQLIGRTGVRLWDPGREPPALLAPGATVRFVPSSRA